MQEAFLKIVRRFPVRTNCAASALLAYFLSIKETDWVLQFSQRACAILALRDIGWLAIELALLPEQRDL
ncbi:hypothetical protein [Paraburkholderia saeva]|uniref:hypothetical protein n=1 Tax=Paraburkholderia saeva TaxID=2777537 RepID=UPI001E4FE198|nr:hypothetical protein [Paraburkholderia saeva]